MPHSDNDTLREGADPVRRLHAVTGRVPPEQIAAFYRAAKATDIEGMPLIVVGPEPHRYPWKILRSRSKDEIEVNERYSEVLVQDRWPIAEDGFGGVYVAMERDGVWQLGFIDPMNFKSEAIDTSWSSVGDFCQDMLNKLRLK